MNAPLAPLPPLPPPWAYQPPYTPADFPRQRYYRVGQTGNDIEPEGADGARLQLFRFRNDEQADLTIEVPAGRLCATCPPALLLALRDACNDALADIDAAREERERRESFEAIRAELEACAELGGEACMYAHPDVHYVPADQVVAKLLALDAAGAERYLVLVDPYAAAPAPELAA